MMSIAAETPLPLRRFNVDEFIKMSECGLLPERGVELWDGIVTEMRCGTNAEPYRHRFSRDDYYRMAELGILKPDERVELIDGELIQMSPIGSRHAAAVTELNYLFMPLHPSRAILWIQNPLHLETDDEPQPDLLLLEPRKDRYANAHPRPTNVLLLIEVADTTHDIDTGRKLRDYAIAGIKEYWVFDLKGRRLLAYREPIGQEYQSITEYDPNDSIAPAAFADFPIALNEVFSS